MTNLLAAITVALVTNVVETPAEFERFDALPCPDGSPICLVAHMRGVNPRAKTITETVKEVRTAKVQWQGKEHVLTDERILSSTSRVYRLEWREK